MTLRLIVCTLLWLSLAGASSGLKQAPAGTLPVDDPEVRAVIDRFFAAQVAEDADGYLALWSATGQRPTRAQLRFIFDSGDDAFSGVAIERITAAGGRLRVRVAVTRERTDTANPAPDGTPRKYVTRLALAITLVREAGALRIVSEGAPVDDLASALVEAPTPEERGALMDTDPDVVGEMLISSLSRRADGAARGLDFTGAIAIYERVVEVARRAGNRKSEGQALQNIGNAEYFQRAFGRALEAYRRRLALERGSANDEGIAEALVGIATVQYSTFEYVDALATYREAATIQERLGDGNSLGTTLISTGNVQYLQGDYDGAIADYRRSRDLLHKAFNLGSEARALEGLGRAYTAQGDYTSALDALSGVVAEGRARSNEAMLGNAMQSIGDVHFRLANLDTARSAFDESRVHFEAARDPASVGRAWQAIAFTDLAAARFAAAEQEYGKSMAVCSGVNDRECGARALVGLAFAQSSQEHYADAVATYKKGIDAFTALNRITDAARAEVGLSQAQLGLKDFDQARIAATHARDAAAGAGADDVVWRAMVAQARAFRKLGAPDKAMLAAREAVAFVERLGQAAILNPSQRLSADAVAAHGLLAILLVEAGDPGAALTVLEQRRAVALRSALANNERDIWRGMTASERNEERTLAAALVSVSTQLDQEKQLPRPDAVRLERLRTRVAEAIASRAAQQQRVFDRLPDLRRWRGLLSPPPDLLARVPAGRTVAEFAIDDDDLVAVTMSQGPEGPSVQGWVHPVRRLEVAQKVAALTAAVGKDSSEWTRAASDVAALLPGAALKTLAAATDAIVVPDDVLWRVPFEALPAGAGLVADRTTITYAGSVAALDAPAPSPVESRELSVVAVAAPDLATDRVERVRLTSPAWTPRASETATREVTEVAATIEATTLLVGAQATESATRAAGRGTVLHVAAPFAINGSSPLFSRLFLSAGTPGDAADDGVLEAREIFNVDAAATMAVLSDGSAAAMRDAASAWPIVQWSWRAAGVPTMLMARWTAPSPCGEVFVAEFYRQLAGGRPPARAVVAAQAKLRAVETTRHPACWAGWILIGAS